MRSKTTANCINDWIIIKGKAMKKSIEDFKSKIENSNTSKGKMISIKGGINLPVPEESESNLSQNDKMCNNIINCSNSTNGGVCVNRDIC